MKAQEFFKLHLPYYYPDLIEDPLFWIDFYKAGHIDQYPKDTHFIWSNWTGRSSRVPGAKHITWFSMQYFIMHTLQDAWQKNFFNRSLADLVAEYRLVIQKTLRVENPRTDHIEALHRLGYLPIKIYALPEGSQVPLGVPMFIITNTHKDFFWLPNFLETIVSNETWKACTSATTARRFRRMILSYVRQTGETDLSFVDWMAHDFSMRGMSGLEDAILSGMGHLLSFSGTDTIPAILAAHKYYGAPLDCGGSVFATEHSVMCAGSQEGEFETLRRLIEDVYPTEAVSIVSDTWDLWRVLTDYVPRLKDSILKRDNNTVFRPDSGDPVKIVIGDYDSFVEPVRKGVIELLFDTLGATENAAGYRLINKGRCIYGDSITYERGDQILYGLLKKKFHPYNQIFGVGSYTYEYVTRDVYNFAMKATAVVRSGVLMDIFKKPVTDTSNKASHRGIPVVYFDAKENDFIVRQGEPPEALDNCAFVKVFENGEHFHIQTFDEIRARVRSGE